MKWLRAFSILVDLIAEAVSYFRRRKAERREEERKDAHEQIDADLDRHLADNGLRPVEIDLRRTDGAPLDYVPGASGGLSDQVHRGGGGDNGQP